MNLRKYPTKKWFKEQSKKLNDAVPENKEVTRELTDKEKQLIRQIAEKHCLTPNEVIQVFEKSLNQRKQLMIYQNLFHSYADTLLLHLIMKNRDYFFLFM